MCLCLADMTTLAIALGTKPQSIAVTTDPSAGVDVDPVRAIACLVGDLECTHGSVGTDGERNRIGRRLSPLLPSSQERARRRPGGCRPRRGMGERRERPVRLRSRSSSQLLRHVLHHRREVRPVVGEDRAEHVPSGELPTHRIQDRFVCGIGREAIEEGVDEAGEAGEAGEDDDAGAGDGDGAADDPPPQPARASAPATRTPVSRFTPSTLR